MVLQPREPAATESYPTFWDEIPTPSVVPPLPLEDAYSTFVNLAEDDSRADAVPDGE
jgi:hypothetical protein